MIIAQINKINTYQYLESFPIFPSLMVLNVLLCHVGKDHRSMPSEHCQVTHYVALEHTMGIDVVLTFSYYSYKK